MLIAKDVCRIGSLLPAIGSNQNEHRIFSQFGRLFLGWYCLINKQISELLHKGFIPFRHRRFNKFCCISSTVPEVTNTDPIVHIINAKNLMISRLFKLPIYIPVIGTICLLIEHKSPEHLI